MTHEEKVAWLDQLEDSLTRAELGKKDRDLIVLLRWAYKKALEELKQEEPWKDISTAPAVIPAERSEDAAN